MESKIPSRVYAKVDLSAISHNLCAMRRNMDNQVMICAVLKTNGYGHGAVRLAQYLQDKPYLWGIAVATVEEALTLRQHGIEKPILILGYTFPEDDEVLIREAIRPTVFTLDRAKILSERAQDMGTCQPIHIAVDTGMSRIGFPCREESLEEISQIASLPALQVEGLFTHFARADEEDKTNTQEALMRYTWFFHRLEHKGIEIPIKHCANSAAGMELKEAHMDMVRAGISMYGIYPSDEMNREAMPLIPAMELISHVCHIKDLPAHTPISYGGTYCTDRPSRIATIPVGYGDGYPRSLSNKGWVLIHGQKAPICGRICMDQFMVDVTDIPDVHLNDRVVLMGQDGKAQLSVDELGRLSGRFPYEFVCDIGPRVPRVYVEE